MDRNCTIYRASSFIGRRWTLLILHELYRTGGKRKRYSELKERLPGITPKILSTRLKELEKEGLIRRTVDSTRFPIKCEYELSESGIEFIDVLRSIKRWAVKWKYTNAACSSTNCKFCKIV